MSTSFRKLSEEILAIYYKGIRSDRSQYSLRFIAELIANEVAFFARKNAFENSNAGEVTYANDTFITTYKSLPVLNDTVLGQQYVVLPSTPTALPNNQEIQKVWPTGTKQRQIVPIANHSKFSQDMLPTIRGMVLYYIENNNLVFVNPSAFSFAAVNINMVGGFPEGNLLDAILSVPKNYETEITDKILGRLNSERPVQRDLIDNIDPLPA